MSGQQQQSQSAKRSLDTDDSTAAQLTRTKDSSKYTAWAQENAALRDFEDTLQEFHCTKLEGRPINRSTLDATQRWYTCVGKHSHFGTPYPTDPPSTSAEQVREGFMAQLRELNEYASQPEHGYRDRSMEKIQMIDRIGLIGLISRIYAFGVV
ncbi:uncharacterized protein I303_100225 [Kwoniella dejecticola CBS 10117]|uniref:Uncharacterized protein n=1 Tax=Kwoniella dejecticola CBS 10117 TaxID=1296121 RepID=A0A1A6AEC1_9TREE|nr:uncharacterized protein I303_00227 [Kwoniella dejecticola CBS 10117]OBR88410.1 hypothetical protein I303_00227 [Kwoniella dejecticola CBS 10117]